MWPVSVALERAKRPKKVREANATVAIKGDMKTAAAALTLAHGWWLGVRNNSSQGLIPCIQQSAPR